MDLASEATLANHSNRTLQLSHSIKELSDKTDAKVQRLTERAGYHDESLKNLNQLIANTNYKLPLVAKDIETKLGARIEEVRKQGEAVKASLASELMQVYGTQEPKERENHFPRVNVQSVNKKVEDLQKEFEQRLAGLEKRLTEKNAAAEKCSHSNEHGCCEWCSEKYQQFSSQLASLSAALTLNATKD